MAGYTFEQVEGMLEQETLDLFLEMHEAWRSAPREERLLMIARLMGGPVVRINGSKYSQRVPATDLDALFSVGLLRHGRGDTCTFAPEAGNFYDFVMNRRGQPPEVVEETIRALVDHGAFATHYPETARLLRQAIRAVFADNEPGRRTQVGHDVREALITFTEELASRFNTSLHAPPHKTTDRLRELIRDRRAQIGSEAVETFLDALVGYWIGVGKLATRQEHGAKAEAETLTWEDSRRTVYAALHIVYEIDRALC